MTRKRPAATLLAQISPALIEGILEINAAAEKRERKVFVALVGSLGDLAEVVSTKQAISDYKHAIIGNSRANDTSPETIEMHLSDALKYFKLSKQRSTKTDSETNLEFAAKHMSQATKYVDLRNSYQGHVSDAYARRKNGTANATHHLIWGAHQMGESDTRFFMDTMRLAPKNTEEIYDILSTRGRGALMHAIGATSTQLARNNLH